MHKINLNCPQFRPIKKYWAIIKFCLKMSSKVMQKTKDMLNMCGQTSKKLSKIVVRKKMASIKIKALQLIPGEEQRKTVLCNANFSYAFVIKKRFCSQKPFKT